MTELQIQRCPACDTTWFPDRLRCPTCGGPLNRIAAGAGTVEEHTTLRRQNDTKIASVRLDAGPVVIARLADATKAQPRVRLTVDDNGAITAQ